MKAYGYLCIRPQVSSTYDVNVTMSLALQPVTSKVGEYTETVGGVHRAHVHRQVAHAGQQAAAPHLYLAHVLSGHDQQHQGDPCELVYDDHKLVIQISVLGRFLAV